MVMTPYTNHAVGRARLLTRSLDCANATTGAATGTWHTGFANQGAMKPSIGGSARHLAAGTT